MLLLVSLDLIKNMIVTSFDSVLKVDVDAKSVIGKTWHRWESTFSHRNEDIVFASSTTAAASEDSPDVEDVVTRKRRIVPVWIPTEM